MGAVPVAYAGTVPKRIVAVVATVVMAALLERAANFYVGAALKKAWD